MKFHLILLPKTIKLNLTCNWKKENQASFVVELENKIPERKFFSFSNGFPIFLNHEISNALILRKFEIELLNRFAFRTVSIEDRVGTKYTPRRFVGQGVIDDFHLHEAWLNVARSDCDGATMRLRERQWNLAAPLYILLHCLRVKTSRRRRVEIGQGKKCRGVPTRVRDTPSPLRPEPWEKTRFHKKKNKKSLFFIKVHAFAIKFRVTRQKFRPAHYSVSHSNPYPLIWDATNAIFWQK